MLRTDKRESTDHSFVIDGMTADFIHDAAYAHALVQALYGAPDMTHQRRWIFERADEIMRWFGYDTDT